MVQIEINNHKCKILCGAKDLLKIQKKFKVRHPNAYFVRLQGRVSPNWDGMIDYVTEVGYFKTGLLPQVYNYITKDLEKKVKFSDNRANFKIKPVIPEKIGNLEPRYYQLKAIRSVVENKVGELSFPMGVVGAATNAGKTMIAAGIYLAYKRKIPALILINDGDLFDQFRTEIPALLGNDVGFVRGKEQDWKNVTVAMVQTLSRNINVYKNKLTKFGIVLVDEADLANNKTYTKILNNCYNADVRCGLSGSMYLSQLKKDFTKEQNLKGYFGEKVFTITNKEMVEKGHSTNIVIRIFSGNKKVGVKGNWKDEYDLGITYNEKRAMLCVDRVKYNAKRKRIPAMVICKFHNHIELMEKIFQRELGKKYKIKSVHGDTKDRKKILVDFRDGKIDILICSYIVRRGKNFPLVRYLLNAAGSDSHSTVLQLMGRLFRKLKGKNKAYMEDFFDEGVYLKRHSKHRVIYYKKEGFKLIEQYKK